MAGAGPSSMSPSRASTGRRPWPGLRSDPDRLPNGIGDWQLAIVLGPRRRRRRDRRRGRQEGTHPVRRARLGAVSGARSSMSGRRRRSRRTCSRSATSSWSSRSAADDKDKPLPRGSYGAAPDPRASGRAGRHGPAYRPRAGDDRRLQLRARASSTARPRPSASRARRSSRSSIWRRSTTASRRPRSSSTRRSSSQDRRSAASASRRTIRRRLLRADADAHRPREVAQPDDRAPRPVDRHGQDRRLWPSASASPTTCRASCRWRWAPARRPCCA